LMPSNTTAILSRRLLGPCTNPSGAKASAEPAGFSVTANKAALSRTERLTQWSTSRSGNPGGGARRAGTVRPRLGFRPNTPHIEAGMRIDPPASLAWANGTMPAATAAAEPPDEPPVEYARFHGLAVGPNAKGSVLSIDPNSGTLVMPQTIRPATRLPGS